MASTSPLRAEPSPGAASAIMSRLLRGGFVILLVVVAGVLAAAIVARFLGFGLLVVRGGSMGEALPNGALVVSRWVAADQVKPGDIIVIREGTDPEKASPKIHRVVSVDEDEGEILVRTRGDRNNAPDPNVYLLPDRVMTPALSLPYVGLLVAAIATPLGWILLVVLPAAALCFSALRAIWSDWPRRALRKAYRDDRGFA